MFFLALFQIVLATGAESLTLSQYLEDVSHSHSNVLALKSKLEQTKNHAKALSDPFLTSSQATLGAAASPPNSITPIVSGEFTQSLPWGQSLSVSAMPSTGNTGTDSDELITLRGTQELIKNGFGSLNRKNSKKAWLDHDANRFLVSDSLTQLCHDSALLFIKAALNQKRLTVYEKIYSTADRLNGLLEKSRKRQLISQIDALGAQSDYLKTKEQLLQFKTRSAETFNALFVQSTRFKTPLRLETDVSLPEISPEKEISNNLALNSQSVTLSAMDMELDIFSEKSLPSLGLFAEAQRSLGNSQFNYAGGVQLSWILYDSSRSSLERELEEARLQALHEYESEKANLSVKLNHLKEEISVLTKQIEWTKSRLKIATEQEQIAYKQTQVGRMEFFNYSQYRDTHAKEELTLLDLEEALWSKHLDLLKIEGKSLSACKSSVPAQ